MEPRRQSGVSCSCYLSGTLMDAVFWQATGDQDVPASGLRGVTLIDSQVSVRIEWLCAEFCVTQNAK